jgi:hypothetical protein
MEEHQKKIRVAQTASMPKTINVRKRLQSKTKTAAKLHADICKQTLLGLDDIFIKIIVSDSIIFSKSVSILSKMISLLWNYNKQHCMINLKCKDRWDLLELLPLYDRNGWKLIFCDDRIWSKMFRSKMANLLWNNDKAYFITNIEFMYKEQYESIVGFIQHTEEQDSLHHAKIMSIARYCMVVGKPVELYRIPDVGPHPMVKISKVTRQDVSVLVDDCESKFTLRKNTNILTSFHPCNYRIDMGVYKSNVLLYENMQQFVPIELAALISTYL